MLGVFGASQAITIGHDRSTISWMKNHFYGTTAFGEFELKCWGVQRSSAAGHHFFVRKRFLKAKPTMTGGSHFWKSSSKMDTTLILVGSLYPKSFQLKSTILEGCWGFTQKSTSFAASETEIFRIYCTALSIWPPSFLLPRKSRMGVEGWWKVEKLELSRVNWLETDSRAISSQVPL